MSERAQKARKAGGTLLLVAGVGVVAYVFRDQLAGLFQPRQQAPQGGGLLDSLLAPILGQLDKSLNNLRDPNSEERQGLKNLDTAFSQVLRAVGLKAKEDTTLTQLSQSSYSERIGAERYAKKVFSYASRPDVREWKATGEGFTIFYEGRAEPFVQPVPTEALYPSAWVLEAPARMLAPAAGGAVPQSEIGPFGSSVGKPGKLQWLDYDEPAFSDNNPAAPRDFTISGLHNPPTFGPLPQGGNQ